MPNIGKHPIRKQKLILSVPAEALENFAAIAARAHLTPTEYGALVISRLSDLRPERALSALTAIPDDFFKRGPGRPPAGTVRTDLHVLEPAGQNPS